MQYTMLGKTGLKVSRLGFGAMRLPMQGEIVDRGLAIPMIHRAFEAGVTYIDTAVFYCQQDSQRAVGEALKGWRDRIVLSTKNHCFEADEKAWWTNLENSLERLDVQHIDIYNTHGINAESYDQFVVPHIYKWLEKPCPTGVDIPQIFAIYNTGRVYGLLDHARAQYAQLEKARCENLLPADCCIDCGQCLPKCPQGIAIPEQLRNAHQALSGRGV